jgi:hypothetical protein
MATMLSVIWNQSKLNRGREHYNLDRRTGAEFTPLKRRGNATTPSIFILHVEFDWRKGRTNSSGGRMSNLSRHFAYSNWVIHGRWVISGLPIGPGSASMLANTSKPHYKHDALYESQESTRGLAAAGLANVRAGASGRCHAPVIQPFLEPGGGEDS